MEASIAHYDRLIDVPLKLTDFSSYWTKRSVEREETSNDSVVCSYWPNFFKLYVILIVWAKFALDVYVSYFRQFKFLNEVATVPEELQLFYTENLLEEAKTEFMFRTILRLEQGYNDAIHLSVIYLSNMYCTIWWMCARVTENILSRSVLFSILTNAFTYQPGEMVMQVRYIVSSFSISQGTCKVCILIKNILTTLLSNIFTTYFMEELIISIMLALVTTPLVIVLFLAFRLYKLYHPTPLEESMTMYVELKVDHPLRIMLNQLCLKLGFKVYRFYVSNSRRTNPHAVQIRGIDKDTCLILGRKLVDGYITPNLTEATYTKNEIAVAVMRAIADSKNAIPRHDIILEASRWSTLIIYSILVTMGFYGNSRLGFVPSPPPYIAYIMSVHLSLPIRLIIYTIKTCLLHSRQFRLDGKVAATGMGNHLISYVAKEAIANNRCPIEDPMYTLLFSDYPPLNIRIRHIKSISYRINSEKI